MINSSTTTINIPDIEIKNYKSNLVLVLNDDRPLHQYQFYLCLKKTILNRIRIKLICLLFPFKVKEWTNLNEVD
jgi:hypothetical protein